MSFSTDRTYLAGPMTGRAGLNHPAFHAVARWARALNRNVVSPAEFGLDANTPWTDCMRVAVRALSQCNEVFLLPGWKHSKGAKVEAKLADLLGLRLYEISLDDIAKTMRAAGTLPRLPQELVASTITALIHAELAAGASARIAGNSIFPVDEDGVVWGTNPYGVDFLIAEAVDASQLGGHLERFVTQVLQGEQFGPYPPGAALADASAYHSARP